MPIPRKRSCAQCRRSKTRCCLSAPRCSRCLAKKLDCDYSDALPRAANTGSTVQISWPDSQPNADATIDIGISTATREGSPGPLTRILSPDFQLDSLWETPTILEMTEGSPDTQPWFEYQNVGQFVPEDSRRPQDASPEQQSPEIYPIGPPDDNSYIEELSRSLVIPGISWCPLQTIPPMYHAILSRRQSQNFGTSLMINHLLATISTFPNMLSTQTLPPFIHRYCWSPSVDSHLPNKKHEVPEPLANCISFIPMFSSKTSASNTFVMRTLFTEVQRLHIEFTFFDRPQKLAAVQALIIYIILYTGEQDRCILLSLTLVLVMSEIVAALQPKASVPVSERRGNGLSWTEWIFGESIRRTMALLYLLYISVHVDTGYAGRTEHCYGLEDIPLPCHKHLWEAGSEEEWEERYKSHLSTRQQTEYLNIGDLKMANRPDGKSMLDDRRAKDLETWSAAVDDLGSLVLLAIK